MEKYESFSQLTLRSFFDEEFVDQFAGEIVSTEIDFSLESLVFVLNGLLLLVYKVKSTFR